MVEDLDILKEKLEVHLRLLRKIEKENEEVDVNISRNIIQAQIRLKQALTVINRIQAPKECVSPICNSTDVRYPSHDPRYCLDCYREKAS